MISRTENFILRHREAVRGGLSGLAAEAWAFGAVASSRLIDRALMISAGPRVARAEEMETDLGAVLDWLFS